MKTFILVTGVFLLLGSSCGQDDLRKPVHHDDVPPGTVDNIKVDPLPGGATISYSLPADLDLLYVQADYDIRPGMTEQSTSSFYQHSLLVQGFGDTLTHQISIYSVDRSGNKSAPKVITVRPLLTPVQLAYDSMDYSADFGGIRIKYVNEAGANIVFTVLVKDSVGDWEEFDNEYTGLPRGEFGVRGMPFVPVTCGVFVKDRWDNHSDTMVKQLTPLFEAQLDKTKFKELPLPGDFANSFPLSAMFDNNPSNIAFHTTENQGLPVWFNFDMGVKAKLSRFRMWGLQQQNRWFTSGDVKTFQLWGSNAPNPDGSFDGWIKLGDPLEVVKPSGLPDGVYTDDDLAAAKNGLDFNISQDAPAVRYIRFEVLSTFASPPGSATGPAWLDELTFWGQVEP